MQTLSTKQSFFVKAYLSSANLNASEAAKIAGYVDYKMSGYSLMKNTLIRKMISDELQGRLPPMETVLQRLQRQAEGIPDCCWNIDEETKQPRLNWEKVKELGLCGLIKELQPSRFGTRYSFESRESALNLLGKYYQLWSENSITINQHEPLKLDFMEEIRSANEAAVVEG